MSADHGNTPAAWTAVIIIFAGSVLAGVAVVRMSPMLGAIATALIVLGGIVGKVMQMMGMGQRNYAPAQD